MSNNPQLNPYRRAVSLIYNRLKWDIKLESWRSRKSLKNIKNKYKGEKAVILCNGPSLNKTNFSLLNNVYTFGLNKINLLFDKTSFRPSCIVSVNKLVIEQNAGFFKNTEIPLYLDSKGLNDIGKKENVTYLHSTGYRSFAKDCSISIDQGYTVTYVALQLAYHMGFTEVALIGCDHNFATKGPANKTVESGASDPNHFDPNYFSGGEKWQLPDLFESEVSYKMAKDAYENDGRKIFNSTKGGELDIYPRIKLEDFLTI
ncbi:6-hydroxymethylpterin diphosphokinase MptE-like protein [Fodinibius sp. AD559]|uniref:6-hydroxymethylpterin diphosphokinase MptE-like protein n=1 Tax=Fodinibius sp. AD559 TaxID=3424179 RepID=UPI004046A6E9